MAAHKGVSIQIPVVDSVVIHSSAREEMRCTLGITTPMLNCMKILSIGIIRHTGNLDFSSDTEMIHKGEADILICKDRVEEMEDVVNGDAGANANKNLDIKSGWLPSAQIEDVEPGSSRRYLADTVTRSTPFDMAATNAAWTVVILGAGLERDEQFRLDPRS